MAISHQGHSMPTVGAPRDYFFTILWTELPTTRGIEEITHPACPPRYSNARLWLRFDLVWPWKIVSWKGTWKLCKMIWSTWSIRIIFGCVWGKTCIRVFYEWMWSLLSSGVLSSSISCCFFSIWASPCFTQDKKKLALGNYFTCEGTNFSFHLHADPRI